RRHTRFSRDWSSDVCSSDLAPHVRNGARTCFASAALLTVVACAGGPPNVVPVAQSAPLAARLVPAVRVLDSAIAAGAAPGAVLRSEERRVGSECRGRWAACA